MTLLRGPSTGTTHFFSRRRALRGLAGAAIASAYLTIAPGALAQRPPKRCNPGEPPDRNKFQSGDFLWPKLPGTYQPFASGSAATAAIERAEWMHGRDELVAKLEAEGSPTSRALAAELKDMTFEQFHVRYINGARPGENVPFSSGRLGTGHIGILDIDRTGPPYVIEAMPQLGVQRISYDDWLKGRACELIWHGRIDGLSPEKRAGIAAEASRYIGRPYDFWNLQLDDTSSFYCSKLVWLAVWRATGIALDGDPSPGPRFWVSPKQLLFAEVIVRLHNPQDTERG